MPLMLNASAMVMTLVVCLTLFVKAKLVDSYQYSVSTGSLVKYALQ